MRITASIPQAWQIETALVDQAVVKVILGPTSRTDPTVSSRKLAGP